MSGSGGYTASHGRGHTFRDEGTAPNDKNDANKQDLESELSVKFQASIAELKDNYEEVNALRN